MSALEGLAVGVLSWAVTYAIHSSLLLGLAFILTRWVARSDVWRETVWKGALVGSVLTATLATTLPLEPLGGRVHVPHTMTARGPAILSPTTDVDTDVVGPSGPETERNAAPDAAPTGRDATPGAVDAARDAASRPSPAPESDGPAWASILVLGWAAVAIVLLGTLLARNVRLFRSLRGRERLTEGPLAAMLAELRRRAGVWRPVALSVSDACPTPLVIGSSEICLPPRFLTGLDEGQQRAALAHELAHVRRRDSLWQIAMAALNAVVFFQPLNVLARRRLREASEHLCDDWAIRLTGAPLSLGQCLAAVASWTAARPLPALNATHAMAEGGSPLVHRIRRISGGVSGAPELRLPAVLAVGVLVLATAVGAPASGPPDADTASPAQSGATGLSDGPTSTSSTPSAAASDTLETVRLLERLAMDDASTRVRQEAVAELADIRHPAAAAALTRIVRRAGDADVRAEAAQQLDEFPTDAVVAVLLEVVFEDSVDAVRSNALDVLADVRLASAREALLRIVRTSGDATLRQEAAQQLDAFPTDDVAAVLLEVAFEDSVAAVRFEAIDTLADLADESGLASAREALSRLALEHPLPDARLEAMAALPDDGG